MNKILQLTMWLIAGSQLTSCHKSVSPELPPVTLSGQRTFGCLVNGKVWLPGGPVTWFGGRPNMQVMAGVNPDGKATYISVYAQINKGEKSISFFKNGITNLGDYQLGNDSTAAVQYRDESLPKGCQEFTAGRDYPNQRIIDGKFTLTRNSGGVAAGRFSFLLVQPDCDTIRITEGRFDIPY